MASRGRRPGRPPGAARAGSGIGSAAPARLEYHREWSLALGEWREEVSMRRGSGTAAVAAAAARAGRTLRGGV